MVATALTSDPSAEIPIVSAQHSLEWTLSVLSSQLYGITLVVGVALPSNRPPEGGGAPIYAAVALLRSFITIAGSYSVPFFSIPKKILVIFPAIAIKDCIFLSGLSFLVV